MPSSRRSSQSRGRTHVPYVSCIGRWVLYHWYHFGSQEKKKKELKAFWSLGESALCHALEGCYLMYSDVTNKNEPTPNTESNTNQLLHGFPL